MPSRIGDVGTAFEVYVQRRVGRTIEIFDLSGSASEVQFHFKRPGGTVTTVDAVIVDPPDSGLTRYIVDDADFFDETGMWEWQARVTTADGTWTAAVRQFAVEDTLITYPAPP